MSNYLRLQLARRNQTRVDDATAASDRRFLLQLVDGLLDYAITPNHSSDRVDAEKAIVDGLGDLGERYE